MARFGREKGVKLLVILTAPCLLSGAVPFAHARAMAKNVHHDEVLGASFEERHRVFEFTILALNTNESVTVRYRDGMLDEPSGKAVDHVMRCLRTDVEAPIDRRLIDALRDIAIATDAPRIELISGYRVPERRSDHSYHNRAQAADIRVPGIGTWKLREVAYSLGIKGIGLYPTTHMIHVDVREEPWFWTDWSGPTYGARR